MTAIYKRSRMVKTTDRAITKWQKPSNAQISNYAQYFGFKVVTNINSTMTDQPTRARDKKILTPTGTSSSIRDHNNTQCTNYLLSNIAFDKCTLGTIYKVLLHNLFKPPMCFFSNGFFLSELYFRHFNPETKISLTIKQQLYQRVYFKILHVL